MSDTGMQITAEDRERLAKSKFGEWFDEFFEKKFDEAIKKAVPATPRGEQRKAAEGQQQGEQQQSETPAPRRRSLLETCLSETFGF
jgi:hypothetical protein